MANSKRKCGGCGRYFPPERQFPGPVAWCSFECAMRISGKRKEAAKKRFQQECRKEHRQAKAKLRNDDRAHQFALTKKSAQKLANRLDKAQGFGCISCGTNKSDTVFCGGHFKTAGAFPERALDLRNIHRQCNVYCNKHLSGNLNGNKTSKGYRAGIVERYGKQYLEWLESYQEHKKLSCEELKELRAVYEAECRRIERGEPPSRDWRALRQSE